MSDRPVVLATLDGLTDWQVRRAEREMKAIQPGVLAELNLVDINLSEFEARIQKLRTSANAANMEDVYLTLVRDLGQSIESSDTYTFGHSERVANYAALVATALRFNERQRTTIRVGAYLHDVGKVRVPVDILRKPGKLTMDETAIIKMHPVWGVEVLAGIEFPWDIKPIIRWHHEKYDGSGYPDGLHGGHIPLAAQVVGIVDVYDALTTTRSYRRALTHDEAIAEIDKFKRWWRPDVYGAFRNTMDRAAAALAQQRSFTDIPQWIMEITGSTEPKSLLYLIQDRLARRVNANAYRVPIT